MKTLADADRRLLALAAVFSSTRAPALLSWLLTEDEVPLREAASRLARSSARERLAALGEALGEAVREPPGPQPANPALRRLLREPLGPAEG